MPLALRLSGKIFQRFGIAGLQGQFEGFQRGAESLGLLQHFFAVRAEDVALSRKCQAEACPTVKAGQRRELFCGSDISRLWRLGAAIADRGVAEGNVAANKEELLNSARTKMATNLNEMKERVQLWS